MGLFVDDQVRACADGDRDHGHPDHLGEGFSDTCPEDHFQLDTFHLFGANAEPIAFVGFHREGLDREDIAEGFEEDFVEARIASEDTRSGASDFTIEKDHDGHQSWSQNQREQKQTPVDQAGHDQARGDA